MSSLEKRQANRRGSTHGPRKCSDGISDTSSVGSFMDDTDREVSSLTDRAFRSLCIGEDAIYNDLEVSSPADQRKACAQEALQKKDLRTNCQEFSSHCIQYEETEREPEVASTFQHSCVDVAQEHVLGDKSLSYISNGCMEGTWQQKRSASRVSSLIKAFSSGENYCDSGAPDTVQDKYQDFNNELWDKSALLSIQRELSEKDLTEIHATAPRSNTSSPATGKPIMFRVKDNTVDSCYGSEKDKVDYDNENDPKESANSPVLHEQSVTSHRFSSLKEIQARNRLLSPGFMAPKEPRSYNRRSQVIDGDESRSLMSTVSEDVRSLAASSAVRTNNRDFDTEHVRRTYARPESCCYERPESACYERPESACSDMRPASKPPTVPPKTEKALRRAKRLTSRRIRQVEDKMTSDTQVQPESKSIRTVSSLPASPMVQMSTSQSVQAPPPMSHYHVEPNCAPPAPSIVAHSFPMTQRKFLQDPNSGQIFMVDMPVQVKTKTFFDPETGKYLQLNVRQRAQSTLSQPAPLEVLSHPYVVYPGFLPMPVSVSFPHPL
ncbi:hypothetical protein QTP70_004161 [Hemibagrus guttatus]|uniref:DUF4585 domain-containing protein n=1 Tax=Hemibagrus guttatus TaxID=175788 RepID=A0AAE0VCP8_9TELE|nr:hypothetical protein QTP70_004161 [Hemibagrus guttatus]